MVVAPATMDAATLLVSAVFLIAANLGIAVVLRPRLSLPAPDRVPATS